MVVRRQTLVFGGDFPLRILEGDPCDVRGDAGGILGFESHGFCLAPAFDRLAVSKKADLLGGNFEGLPSFGTFDFDIGAVVVVHREGEGLGLVAASGAPGLEDDLGVVMVRSGILFWRSRKFASAARG